MSILFFDTETTGLPNKKMLYSHPSQPRVVQYAAVLTDDDLNEISSVNLIVNNGVAISEIAVKTHGITAEIAAQYGVHPDMAAKIMLELINKADLLVAHNYEFDVFLLKCNGVVSADFEKQHYCTMEESKNIIKLPPTDRMVFAGFFGYKPPKLSEAYAHFFDREFEGAHNAFYDVKACMEVYKKLKQ